MIDREVISIISARRPSLRLDGDAKTLKLSIDALKVSPLLNAITLSVLALGIQYCVKAFERMNTQNSSI